MEYLCTVTFKDEFVLERRGDKILPVEYFLDIVVNSLEEVSVITKSLIDCRFVAEAEFKSELDGEINNILEDMGFSSGLESLVIEDYNPAIHKPTTNSREESKKEKKVPDSYKEIKALLGAESLKELADEILEVAPHVKKHHTERMFLRRCYLFSIEDGCGLSTMVDKLASMLYELNILSSYSQPEEYGYDLTTDPIRQAAENNWYSDKVVILDISHWMDELHKQEYRTVIKKIVKKGQDKLFVFRIPFVDEHVRRRVQTALSDLLTVRAVTIAPYTTDELQQFAGNVLDKMGFSRSEDFDAKLEQRIAEEKSDGKFYGLSTMQKIVDEIVYTKHVKTNENSDDSLIDASSVEIIGAEFKERPAIDQLNELIGISHIVERLEEVLSQIEAAKAEGGLSQPCLHMQFIGNPGTGKTTVARIVAQLLKERGILSRGQLYEFVGRDFCGQYIGETAPKTATICRDAYGSVLFIDEAYSLFRGSDNDRDFGKDAIDTLVSQMENHRNDFMVIMAGYQDDMEKLMTGNVGLQSRIPYKIEFKNYSREELYRIFMLMVKKSLKYDPELEDTAKKYFDSISDEVLKSKEFSNARFVRNLFERSWGKASVRRRLEGSAELILLARDFDKAATDREFSDLQSKGMKKIGF